MAQGRGRLPRHVHPPPRPRCPAPGGTTLDRRSIRLTRRGSPMNAQPVRILGIAGSLRKTSYNRSALRAAASLLPAGATLDTFDIDGLPGFNEDHEKDPPPKVIDLKKRIRAAD